MQVLAVGKWDNKKGEWHTVVALRKPADENPPEETPPHSVAKRTIKPQT